MIGISFDLRGANEAIRTLRQVGLNVRDFRPAWKEFTPILVEQNKQIFEAEGPPGAPWAELTPRYKAKKAHSKYAAKPKLQLGGTLYRSMTTKHGKNAVRVSKQHFFAFGTSVHYAASHNYGYAARNLVARPFIGMLENTMLQLGLILVRHMIKGTRFTMAGEPTITRS